MWALMKAYALDYSFWIAGGVLVIVRLGTLIPSAPGNVELVNAAVVVGIKLFEGNESERAGIFAAVPCGANGAAVDRWRDRDRAHRRHYR